MVSNAEVYRIFICGLSYGVQQDELEFAFQTFGEIVDCCFEFNRHYAFISYTNQKDAILAIAKGKDLIVGDCEPIVEWAIGWPKNRTRRKIFSRVFDETCQNNRTVYCSRLKGKTTQNVLESVFSPFGTIEEIQTDGNRSYYALIRFSRKWDATKAIFTIDGTLVNGWPVTCTWSNRPSSQLVAPEGQSTGFAIGGYQVPFQPAALPPAFNSSSASSSTSITPAVSSTSGTSAESNTIVQTPVASETTSSSSSDLSSLRKQISEILQFFIQLSVARNPSSASTSATAASNEEYANDDFDTVFDETGPDNCIVYCKGMNRNTTTDSLKEIFSPFGIVEEINLHVDRSDYALIRFNTKEAATLAICSINNSKINGCSVKCTWSNRPDDRNQIATAHYLRLSEPVNTSTQLCPPPFCLPSASSTPSNLSVFTSALLSKQDKSSGAEKEKKRNTDIFCKICMDEELGVVFLPCGHLTSCSKCAEKIYFCPLCRTLITSKVRTYLS